MNPETQVEYRWGSYDYETDSWTDLAEIAAFVAEDIETITNTRDRLKRELADAHDNDPLWGAFT